MARGPDPEVSDLEILHFFMASPDPAFVSSEVANYFDISVDGARHRLESLVDKGYLDVKKPGTRSKFYWITEKGMEHYADKSDAL